MKGKTVTMIAVLLAFATVLAGARGDRGGGFAAPTEGTDGWYAKSFALVVGIDSYSRGWGRLSAGVSDAKRMAATLRSQGFNVQELYDTKATGSAIVAALRQASRRTSQTDRFVFFYAGHGYTEKSAWDGSETGYLVPVDGRSGNIENYISVSQIRDEVLANCKARHVLLILDSCFSGTLLTRSGFGDGAVDDYLNKRGIYGITAGMQDQPALDGLFTGVLIEGLDGNADANNDGYVTFKELGLYAEQNVHARNRHQTPDYGVMYGAGQMVFAPARIRETSPPPSMFAPVPPVNNSAIEPEPAVAEPAIPGYLLVRLDPWAEIYINGKYVNETPVRLELLPGTYRIVLVNKKLNRAESRTVEIRSGESTKILNWSKPGAP